jgi:hypothetical protein
MNTSDAKKKRPTESDENRQRPAREMDKEKLL